MNPEQRRLTLLMFSIDFPQLDRAKLPAQIAEFFPRAHDYYPFEECRIEAESGGTIETEGKRRITIRRETIDYQERVVEDFSVVKMNAVHILELALLHFEIPVFIVKSMMLRQRWGAGQSTSKALREHAIKLGDQHFEPLGAIEGAGLHLIGTREEPYFHWHLRVEPSQQDDNELFVEVQTYFAEPVEESKGLDEALQVSYDYLTDNVGRFVDGFMP